MILFRFMLKIDIIKMIFEVLFQKKGGKSEGKKSVSGPDPVGELRILRKLCGSGAGCGGTSCRIGRRA